VSSSPTETEHPSLVEIIMPQLGVSVAEGTLLIWHKQPGDRVAADEAICDVASDKVDSEIPAPCAGEIVELLVAPGETVEIGTVIATMTAEGASPSPSAAPAAPERVERHSPVVLRVAAERGVDLATVVGTGAGGRIRKEDVLAAPGAAGDAAYVPPAPVELSRMRQLIGEHMKRSLDEAATVTSWIEVDFERVERRRRELGVTALPIVAQATIATLGEFGDLNVWLDGERYVRHVDVNLGIAVALDEGLIVPVIRGAQALDVPALAELIRDLAARARAGALSPDDVRDGTFTITNPGQFGTVMATPVINQPQVAILDMEAIVRRPVVIAGEDGAETLAIHSVCVLGLSFDHRAIDGAYVARFLAALRARLQDV